MPYKGFCDSCHYQVSVNFVKDRAIISHDGWDGEIVLTRNGISDDLVICRACLRSLLTEGTIRPKSGTHEDLIPIL